MKKSFGVRSRFLFWFLLPLLPCFGQTAATAEGDSAMAAFQRMLTPYVGSPFPTFTATLNDSVVSNQSLKGKVVFINFWFESCAPFVAEFGALNDLYTKTKGGDRIVFLSFTFEKPAAVKAVRLKYGIAYPVLSVAHEQCKRLLQRSCHPTSMVLNKEETIGYAHCGGSGDKKTASEWVEKEYYPRLLKRLNH